jgi:hypothetical protein
MTEKKPNEVGYEEALSGIAAGRWTTEEVADVGGWSTSELCVVALVLGKAGPKPYVSAGDAWRRLDTYQRSIVRRYASLAADAAEFASRSSNVADHK